MSNLLQFAANAVIVRNHQLLCLYRETKEGNRLWDLPGGRLEFGEEPEECLRREVFEETGCHVEVVRLIDIWNHMHSKQWQIIGAFYLCRLLDDNIVLSEEHDGYKWIPVEHLSAEFTAKAFLKRMHGWNWETLLDDRTKEV